MMRRAELDGSGLEIAGIEQNHVSHAEAEAQRGAINRILLVAEVASRAGGIIEFKTDSRYGANDSAWVRGPCMVWVVEITMGSVRTWGKPGSGVVRFRLGWE